MEIRKIDNEIINDYPKMNEFNKQDLKKHIPKKWIKFGLSSVIFSMIMKATKTYANSLDWNILINSQKTVVGRN